MCWDSLKFPTSIIAWFVVPSYKWMSTYTLVKTSNSHKNELYMKSQFANDIKLVKERCELFATHRGECQSETRELWRKNRRLHDVGWWRHQQWLLLLRAEYVWKRQRNFIQQWIEVAMLWGVLQINMKLNRSCISSPSLPLKSATNCCWVEREKQGRTQDFL